ncbi:HAD-IB family hydrolase [Rhodococcus triatomae]|uniref:HAD-superfamily subfamily IB hydrolase, TIGR01490 n=1 Tax=Rhodococcus triatomae TaxID=300028 RepID=A0A1G8IKD4_9NOCA|nr:HAD-IB family hydrolase [Rhodococcus triatomae]QNG23008.1 HAD-IB family hydrolase [Rhodococcus triatomae]SDI19365.1 HAD-superfamily subfamily IB hydrolase, TIGR01490 [Rhodococcus triatomae]
MFDESVQRRRRAGFPPILERVTTTRSTTTGNTPATGRVAAFFDLDKTIIAKSSTLAFSRPLFDQGLINRRSVLKSSYAQFLFMLSGADHDQMERMRAYLTSMTAGWNVEQVRAVVAETLHDIVDPLVFAEAADLIADHRARGHDVVVVSASGQEVVQPIADAVGADHSIATRLAVADGKYTGEVDFYCYGPGKVEGIEALARERGYDLARSYAYSDSVTDLPMLEAVGHPTAVNPDRGLRKAAAEKGWPMLTFSNPVSLRARLSSSSTPVLATGAALFVGAVLAGAFTYGALRRRR